MRVYNKIITNQKMRVYDIATENYMSLAQKLIKELPQEPLDLAVMHHHKIERFIIQDSLADASNCMDLGEYLSVYERLLKQITKRYGEIQELNCSMRR